MSQNADWADPNWAASSPMQKLLPYTPPVGNQPIAEQQSATGAKTRQAQQSVQLTDYTWIEQTTGVGVGAFTVLFDVAFTQEPVVSHGMTLPDFGTEIRDSVNAANQDAQDAQGAADAYQWTFPGNITVGTFQSYDDKQLHQESTPYKFAVRGISNSTNDGKKMSIVFTYPNGDKAAAVLHSAPEGPGSTGIGVRPSDQAVKLAGFATTTLPNQYINDDITKVTWQLLADGEPVAATGGFDTGTTHKVQILTQAEIDMRKEAATATEGVGNTLALGGDATAFPLCNVYVKRWLLDRQNNYIGADCIVVVKTFGVEKEAPIITPPPISQLPEAS